MENSKLDAAVFIKLLQKKEYAVYSRPYELNIVGLRSPSTVPNNFDDSICVFYRLENQQWKLHIYKATTDPGTYWLRQPGQPQGTAILKQGQYRDVYALDLHRGKYTALCQRKGKVTVIRDYDRDAELDFYNGNEVSGWFGINIHRAKATGTTLQIDRNSAGCQVFANAEDFAAFITMCHRHRELYGNKFTYTLIDLRTLQRALKRKKVIAATGTTAAALAAFWAIYETQLKNNSNTA
jgi:hypothetical protein